MLTIINTMRVDPERIAARLRIEEEIAMDKAGRNRRQLATPKEISISVNLWDTNYMKKSFRVIMGLLVSNKKF